LVGAVTSIKGVQVTTSGAVTVCTAVTVMSNVGTAVGAAIFGSVIIREFQSSVLSLTVPYWNTTEYTGVAILGIVDYVIRV
jgi:hypothetical protein